jgi:hypothetical protein
VVAHRKPRWSNAPSAPAVSLGAGVVAIVSAVGLAVATSFTRPFTLPADVVTAIPLAGLPVAETVRIVRIRSARFPRAEGPVARSLAPWTTLVSWIVLSGVVIGFEVFNYLSLPRHAHPTLSSLCDELSSSHAGKAALFLAWLALGALLFGLGRRSIEPGDRDRVID